MAAVLDVILKELQSDLFGCACYIALGAHVASLLVVLFLG